MRLINVNTKEIEFMHGIRIPYNQYGILSHTWNEKETIFQDWQNPVKRANSPSSRKINATIEQARRDQLQYVWVDTCCIDKTSSAELAEAINSMFTWYRRSAVCYVFLNDVDKVVRFNGSPQVDFRTYNLDQFRKARWFTRGWTLQELLASKRLVFYSKDWEELGRFVKLDGGPPKSGERHDTHTLIKDVSATTGIAAEYLQYADFTGASIAQRMSWAANRQTSLIEDQAYCLVGIFDISMTLYYGEENRAFKRLQEEILNVSTDDSIFAWKWDPTHKQQNYDISLLAPSPKAFEEMGHIRANTHEDDDRIAEDKIVTISCLGLSMRLPIWTSSTTVYEFGMLQCWGRNGTHPCIPLQSIRLDSHRRVRWPEMPLEMNLGIPTYTNLKIERKSASSPEETLIEPPEAPFDKYIALLLLFDLRTVEEADQAFSGGLYSVVNQGFRVKRMITLPKAKKFNEFGMLVIDASSWDSRPDEPIQGVVEIEYRPKGDDWADICLHFSIERDDATWEVFKKRVIPGKGTRSFTLDPINNLCNIVSGYPIDDPSIGHSHDDDRWRRMKCSKGPAEDFELDDRWRFEWSRGNLGLNHTIFQVGITLIIF